jgi:Fic family protein/DNA-binding XRE family transcriptional regulator
MTYQQKLQSIINATGWSQEKLAQELDTSFPTLNSWINNKSQPRRRALDKIELLFARILGSDTIDNGDLIRIKKAVESLSISTSDLTSNKNSLDRLILHLTYHTNTIEGSTMTISDVEDVLFDHKVLSNRTAIEQLEARNHQAALLWLLDIIFEQGKEFKISVKLILDLHVRLMNGLMSNAGQYRRHAVRILGSRVALSNWQKIPNQMEELVKENYEKSNDIVSNLAKSHAVFENIHPFSDGNGRTGRLLMLAQALHHGIYPPIVQRERKQAYYKYLQLAQTEHRYLQLELFIAESIQYCENVLNNKKV